jgi:hypothetical protein
MTQTEIDARETARLEAILQVARWALEEDVTDEASTRCVHYLAAVQHYLIDGPDARDHQQRIVGEALDSLAEEWDELPEGQREVVLAGVLPGGYEKDDTRNWTPWDGLVGLSKLLAGPAMDRERNPEQRARYEREYARQLRALVREVVGA